MRALFFGLVLIVTNSWSHLAEAQDLDAKVSALVKNSKCVKTDWKDRGRATQGYVKGVALVFARSLCSMEKPYVAIAAAGTADTSAHNVKSDALVHYEKIFKNLSMNNSSDGADTLRHTYVLLLGLGMRESSGQHCVGRDLSANFTTADSAEAGLFQTSYGAHTISDSLSALYETYKADQSDCLLDVFSQGVTCKKHDAKNWGDGEGKAWQELTKQCPAFATEFAAVVLRKSGGSEGEFGPIRKHAAEVISPCDELFESVQSAVASDPQLCSSP